mmetsp:Transcript_41569/g.111474  ORF Transcript_41569/g.111474 Transcript_41569/m.111474 type:complete len:340 (+) Transcript_41569:41-1060(+)
MSNLLNCRVEKNRAGCPGAKSRSCLSYEIASGYFLNADPTGTGTVISGQSDKLRYASAAFYCKYAPIQVKSIKTNTTLMCKGSSTPGPCLLWPQQSVATTPSWWLAEKSVDYEGPIYNVRCQDKMIVFRAFITALYGTSWRTSDIQAATGKFLLNCMADKGGDTYILVVGPAIAALGALVTIMTMFRSCSGPPWPDVGTNMLLLSIILLLIGFWSITLFTTSHIAGRYQVCQGIGTPLTAAGRWYDNSPCMDKDSDGKDNWNPFVVTTIGLQSVYIAGGVFTFISVLAFLGISSDATHAVLGDRFGKYLVTLQDVPLRIRLPFPPRQSFSPSAPRATPS